MTLQRKIGVLGLSLAVVLGAGVAFGRGFGGGGFRGGGGFGGGFRGGSFGGFRGGDLGGSRGGYGGMSSFNRSPSFSSAGSFDRGGSYGYGARSGSYDTARGGTINYGAAGFGARGAGGFEGGRAAYGVEGTTAGGRSFADVGRAGGIAGPGGAGVAGRANVGGVEGPRGAAAFGSRTGVAVGAGGAAVAGRGVAGAGYHGYGFNNAYGAYHSGWVHGYWNGHDNAAWGWRGYGGYGGWGYGLGYGTGLGWGLAAWGMGSMLYGMGYMPYDNPYYVAPAVGVADYDYSEPIDTTAAAPAASITDPAIASFDAARTAFKAGDYQDALRQTGTALASLPNDRDIQEFRALCLFALGRYDEAAAPLYSVLSVGPGWDWTTLIGLYPDVDTYTAQLRALEAYCNANPRSSAARFVLTYEYLTEGFTEAAVGRLKEVVALNPKDTLSAKLLRQLDPPKDQPAAATATAAAPADTAPPQGATIAGTWTATPAPGTAITLTIEPGGAFTWRVAQKGKPRQFSGTSTFGANMLTLAQASGPALVGRVSWSDPTHMTFRVVGDGPDDPGLAFAK